MSESKKGASSAPKSSSRPEKIKTTSWRVRLIAFGLVVGVLLLASWLNSRRLFLVVRGKTVQVDRGLFLPYGHRPFEPGEMHGPSESAPGLYAPFELPSSILRTVKPQAFADKTELHDVLFELWARGAERMLLDPEWSNMDLIDPLIERMIRLPDKNDSMEARARTLAHRSKVFLTERHIRTAIEELKRAQSGFLEASDYGFRMEESKRRAREIQGTARVLEGFLSGAYWTDPALELRSPNTMEKDNSETSTGSGHDLP